MFEGKVCVDSCLLLPSMLAVIPLRFGGGDDIENRPSRSVPWVRFVWSNLG